MNKINFFKPTKRKIIFTIIFFVIIFIVPYFKLTGEIFQGGYIRAPLILIIAAYLAFIMSDFMAGIRIFEVLVYLLALLILIFSTYVAACFINKKFGEGK